MRIPLSGDWAPNADGVAPSSNGLTRTPDGRALIMVASNFGTLYRVSSSGVLTTLVSLTAAQGIHPTRLECPLARHRCFTAS